MSHEELMTAMKLAGAIASCLLGGVGVALGFLFRLAWKLGSDAKEIRDGLEIIREMKTEIAELPVIKTRLGTVEDAWRATRSDIKHLLRGSRPGFNGTGGMDE